MILLLIKKQFRKLETFFKKYQSPRLSPSFWTETSKLFLSLNEMTKNMDSKEMFYSFLTKHPTMSFAFSKLTLN